MLRLTAFFLCLAVILAGCGQKPNSGGQSASGRECGSVPVRHFDLETKAESLASQVRGIDRSVAVQIDNELNVAVQVSNFNRLRLKQLRIDVFQKLKEAFPEANVHVTADSKLYRELQKMNSQPWSNDKHKACGQKHKLKLLEEKMRG